MRALPLAIAIVVPAAMPGFAQEQKPSPSTAIEKRLGQFDPRAVAAAKHYFANPQLKTGILNGTRNTSRAIMALIVRQDTALSQETKDSVQSVVDEVVSAQFGLMETINEVAALETFTTDEMIALDDFYSSPGGQVIMGKMPQLPLRMTPMLQSVLPQMVRDIKTRMKERGVELKL